MSTAYLLDTNILIHYARRDALQSDTESCYQLLATPTVPLLSRVSVAEARSFALQRQWSPTRQHELSFLFSAFSILEIDAEGVEDAYVTMDVYSRSVGVKMGKNDLWIAATALVSGATLLTTDQDFDHLSGVFLNRRWIDPRGNS